MYDVASTLTPDSCYELAVATYREMALAGVTSVGEFHYLHHGPGGHRYDDPNAMGHALVQAARDAGIRITLLDTCYLAGGLTADGHLPLDEVQERFSDGSVDAWASRVADLEDDETARVGTAVHSVRAVPCDDLAAVGEFAAHDRRPLHVHLSEQPGENLACEGFYGCSPTELLSGQGLLTPATTVVHATHANGAELDLLRESGARICACPTTEADLGDGFLPVTRVRHRGIPLCVGSDSNVRIDPFEELRELEGIARRQEGRRGVLSTDELWEIGAESGAAALGLESWPAIEVDMTHRSLDGVATEHLRAALLAGCGADVVAG